MNIYLDLFISFFKISLFTIGGGYAMLPLIQSTIVEKGWMTAEAIINFIAIAESTPGPFAINIATFIGINVGGPMGVFAAVSGIFLPPFLIITAIYYLSKNFSKNPTTKTVFRFLRPVVISLILSSFLSIAYSVLFITSNSTTPDFNWFGLILMVLSFAGMRLFKKVHPIIFLFSCAGLGIVFYGFIL